MANIAVYSPHRAVAIITVSRGRGSWIGKMGLLSQRIDSLSAPFTDARMPDGHSITACMVIFVVRIYLFIYFYSLEKVVRLKPELDNCGDGPATSIRDNLSFITRETTQSISDGYRNLCLGGGGVPLQTSKGVWESAVSTITPHPETLPTRFLYLHFW